MRDPLPHLELRQVRLLECVLQAAVGVGRVVDDESDRAAGGRRRAPPRAPARARPAAVASAVSDQPSNGTWGSAASSRRSRVVSSAGSARHMAQASSTGPSRPSSLVKARVERVAHPHGVEGCRPGGSHSCCTTRAWKPCASRSQARPSVSGPAIANAIVARHQAGETGEREARLQVLHHALADGLDHRIDQDRGRLEARPGSAPSPPSSSTPSAVSRPGGTRKSTRRSGTCTWGAARPAPFASASGLHHVPDQARDFGARPDRRPVRPHGRARDGPCARS